MSYKDDYTIDNLPIFKIRPSFYYYEFKKIINFYLYYIYKYKVKFIIDFILLVIWIP